MEGYLRESLRLSVVGVVDIAARGPVSASSSRVSLLVSNQPALRLSTDFLSPVQLTVDSKILMR